MCFLYIECVLSRCVVHLDHVGRCLHKLNQNAGTTNRTLCITLGVNEGYFVASSPYPNTASEAHAIAFEPFDAHI